MDIEQINNFLETKPHLYLNCVSFVFIIMVMQWVTVSWPTISNEYVLVGICELLAIAWEVFHCSVNSLPFFYVTGPPLCMSLPGAYTSSDCIEEFCVLEKLQQKERKKERERERKEGRKEEI